MSEKPSSLKSPVPIACQARPGIGADGPAADKRVAVHFPDRDLAAALSHLASKGRPTAMGRSAKVLELLIQARGAEVSNDQQKWFL